MKPVISITGPTAVGKSAAADALAEHLGGEVISTDAMQVYRGMDIGTAKTPLAQRRVSLHMVDVVDPCEPYSAALFQRDARACLDRLLACDIAPILCGGTGLYIDAVLDDLCFPSGELTGAQRERYQRLAQSIGADALHDLLARRDPASAACIHPHNTRRVIRALEMCDEGASYAEQRAGFTSPRAVYQARRFVLTMEREALYQRIDARVDAMMHDGLLDEVRGLVAQGAEDALTSRQAIGYKELIAYMRGDLSLDEAVGLIKQRSRRYAKRQLSWCRRDDRNIWIDMGACDVPAAVRLILAQSEDA